MPVVRTDGRAYGHVITKFSGMGRLPHFLTHGVPLRARELRYKQFFVGKGWLGWLQGLIWEMKAPSKRAYRPTSPHSPNQQIHAYKNSNVNKICVVDVRFFRSVEIWRLFLFDSPFSDCPYAPTILFSSLPPPSGEIGNNGRGGQGVLRAMWQWWMCFQRGFFSLFESRNPLTRRWMEGS